VRFDTRTHVQTQSLAYWCRQNRPGEDLTSTTAKRLKNLALGEVIIDIPAYIPPENARFGTIVPNVNTIAAESRPISILPNNETNRRDVEKELVPNSWTLILCHG
jgi:hypothetical protein